MNNTPSHIPNRANIARKEQTEGIVKSNELRDAAEKARERVSGYTEEQRRDLSPATTHPESESPWKWAYEDALEIIREDGKEIQQLKAQLNRTCEWRHEYDEEREVNFLRTTCNAFPDEEWTDCRFCLFCGGKVVEVKK